MVDREEMKGVEGRTCLMTAANERLTLFNISSQKFKFSSPARSWLGMTAMYLNLDDNSKEINNSEIYAILYYRAQPTTELRRLRQRVGADPPRSAYESPLYRRSLASALCCQRWQQVGRPIRCRWNRATTPRRAT